MWNTTFSDTLFFDHTHYILRQNIFHLEDRSFSRYNFLTNSGARNEQVQI